MLFLTWRIRRHIISIPRDTDNTYRWSTGMRYRYRVTLIVSSWTTLSRVWLRQGATNKHMISSVFQTIGAIVRWWLSSSSNVCSHIGRICANASHPPVELSRRLLYLLLEPLHDMLYIFMLTCHNRKKGTCLPHREEKKLDSTLS